jgi:hypothetical protein
VAEMFANFRTIFCEMSVIGAFHMWCAHASCHDLGCILPGRDGTNVFVRLIHLDAAPFHGKPYESQHQHSFQSFSTKT